MSKILIVEDNEMNRDMLSRRLERKGFEVVMAEDGAKGVDMSKSENPDLILMDLSLPVMDGWEATSTIKADDSTKNIPIIVLTAHAMAGDREKALEAGADEYDTKPIDFKRLLGKIKDFTISTTDRETAITFDVAVKFSIDRSPKKLKIHVGIFQFPWTHGGKYATAA